MGTEKNSKSDGRAETASIAVSRRTRDALKIAAARSGVGMRELADSLIRRGLKSAGRGVER